MREKKINMIKIKIKINPFERKKKRKIEKKKIKNKKPPHRLSQKQYIHVIIHQKRYF